MPSESRFAVPTSNPIPAPSIRFALAPIDWRRSGITPSESSPKSAPKDAAQRPKNTLYVGRDGADLEGVIRIYLADQDKDGAGWGPS